MPQVLAAASVPEMATPPTGISLDACLATSLKPKPAPTLIPAAAKYSNAVSFVACLPESTNNANHQKLNRY